MVGQPREVDPRGPVSCADRFHQSANAQNAHNPLHVLGQDVQRHFGTDVLERLHLEVRVHTDRKQFDGAAIAFVVITLLTVIALPILLSRVNAF